jgi:hypothetical protein
MTSSLSPEFRTFDAPPPPMEGQLFTGADGGFWKVKRLTVAENPVGFYLVHLCYGRSLDFLDDSMILGPREFAALLRDQELRPHLHSV